MQNAQLWNHTTLQVNTEQYVPSLLRLVCPRNYTKNSTDTSKPAASSSPSSFRPMPRPVFPIPSFYCTPAWHLQSDGLIYTLHIHCQLCTDPGLHNSDGSAISSLHLWCSLLPCNQGLLLQRLPGMKSLEPQDFHLHESLVTAPFSSKS